MHPFLILIYISTLSVIVPFITALIQYKSLNKQLRLFTLFLFITVAKESVCLYIGLQKGNNMPVYEILHITLYLIYLYLFYFEFNDDRTRNFIKFFTIVLIVVYFIDILFVNGLYKMNTITNSTGGIILITLSLLYFYKLLKNIEHQNLLLVPMFWISTGVLFYNVGTLVLFTFQNDLSSLPFDTRMNLWAINSILNILQNILITVALFCQPRKQTI